MPNQIQKPANAEKAQQYLEAAQVCLEALESSLLQAFISIDQKALLGNEAKALIRFCKILTGNAYSKIIDAHNCTKLDLSYYENMAFSILTMLRETYLLLISTNGTAAVLTGARLIARELNDSLETAISALFEEVQA